MRPTPLANFINDNPTVVMLALGFLIMIGMTLIAEGFGVHVPKGYIYAAMAFAAAIEGPQHAVARARSASERSSDVAAKSERPRSCDLGLPTDGAVPGIRPNRISCGAYML